MHGSEKSFLLFLLQNLIPQKPQVGLLYLPQVHKKKLVRIVPAVSAPGGFHSCGVGVRSPERRRK